MPFFSMLRAALQMDRNIMPPDHSRPDQSQQYCQALARLQTFARAMDSKFKIPLLGTRVGWDALIGLIPGIGDATGLILSGYVIVEALRLKVPKPLIGRMLINVLVEFLGGLVPVLGDLFDIYWKSNQRNVQMLQRHLELQLEPAPAKRTSALLLVLLVLSIALLFWMARLAFDQF